MKKFTINCDFEGQIAPFTIFIGSPKEGNHPLVHQAKWLADNRGGTIPAEVMDALSKLQELAKQNESSLEELCVYALGTEEEQAELEAQSGGGDVVVEDEDEEGEDSKEGIEEIAAEDTTGEGGHIEDDKDTEDDLIDDSRKTK